MLLYWKEPQCQTLRVSPYGSYIECNTEFMLHGILHVDSSRSSLFIHQVSEDIALGHKINHFALNFGLVSWHKGGYQNLASKSYITQNSTFQWFLLAL